MTGLGDSGEEEMERTILEQQQYTRTHTHTKHKIIILTILKCIIQ